MPAAGARAERTYRDKHHSAVSPPVIGFSIQRALTEINRKNAGSGKPALKARIGIETGPVVVDPASDAKLERSCLSGSRVGSSSSMD
jgi:hypothetical protein